MGFILERLVTMTMMIMMKMTIGAIQWCTPHSCAFELFDCRGQRSEVCPMLCNGDKPYIFIIIITIIILYICIAYLDLRIPVFEFVCLSWSEVCSARVKSLILLLLLLPVYRYWISRDRERCVFRFRGQYIRVCRSFVDRA